LDSESQEIIDKISNISDQLSHELKPLIQKLADSIAKNLNREEIKNMAALEGIEHPQKTDIAIIINRLREKYNWTFGKTTLYTYIQNEYKNTVVEK